MNRAHRLAVSPMLAVILALAVLSALPAASQAAESSTGQTVYVPCYSHIYHGIKTRGIDLTITLSVRNTDPKRAVTVSSVDYYDTAGALVKRHLEKPLRLEPLMTAEYIVAQTDVSGGSGANFLVRWTSEAPASPLLVEAVMIGTSAQQGISFTSRGVAVQGE